MANSKQVNWRLTDSTRENLRYLSLVTHQSESAVIAHLAAMVAETIRHVAVIRNPAMKEDPHFVMNGGTILSVEEQWAWESVRTALQDVRIHPERWMDRP